jgi:hypothetical protein
MSIRRPIEIGLSTLSFAALLVFAGLWARTHWSADLFRGSVFGIPVEVISVEGLMKITRTQGPSTVRFAAKLSSYAADSREAETLFNHVRRFANSNGFGLVRGRSAAVLMPHWFPVLLFALFWIGLGFRRIRRFSTRSLLIATTLLAILLGLMFAPD